MSPRKLTAGDKEEILDLYRLPQETTSTLAERFKVSSSTISRFLKSRLNEGEYEDLIQQKRLSRTPSGAAQVMSEFQKQQADPSPSPTPTLAPDVAAPAVASASPEEESSASPEPVKVEPTPNLASTPAPESPEQLEAAETPAPVRRMAAASRRRIASPRPRQPVEQQLEIPVVPLAEPSISSTADLEFSAETPVTPTSTAKIPTRRARASVGGVGNAPKPLLSSPKTTFADELEEDDDEEGVHALEEMLGEDIDLDEEDDWDEEDDDDGDLPVSTGSRFSDVQVLPLSDAHFPRTCYLVIDRAAELITQPLQEFQDLGNIPGSEASQRTLPVFDNHRVARRFSKRTQRVIKVPDSILFEKTRTYLQARGITRLLLDGQVYSL
ncbi:MAG: transposase [Spirulina sp. SIO3F2]|nr:transposase [Spirulina sp. SIO3F2]